ncbi:hypothetical protein [uncultured Dysgonomonas sp.]|uniref:hypothetical protein n=1 Tax=uncultured Dysgonomonas sp. TaxID=206096 RepID=UPI0028054595|nr:hypothetical protein [uncultured Dysgonomonas sp.]
MKLYFIIITLSFLLVSCNEKEKISASDFPKMSDKDHIDLIEKAINLNDTNAYLKLTQYHGIYGNMDEILFVALEMANKNRYSQAYYDVYWILTHFEGYNWIEKLEDKTKCLALYYLLKSYESNLENSKYDIEKIFPDTIPKSTCYLIEMSKE